MGLATVLTALLLGTTAVTPALPPVDADWDYQLGGNRAVPDHVTVVDRDRKAEPLEGAYSICYVNGFQTQPDEKRFWRDHWSLVLKRDGEPVVDSAWGEWLLDIRTPATPASRWGRRTGSSWGTPVPTSASTSRSPRSAAGGASARATSTPTATTC